MQFLQIPYCNPLAIIGLKINSNIFVKNVKNIPEQNSAKQLNETFKFN